MNATLCGCAAIALWAFLALLTRGAAEVPREQRHFGPRPRRAAGTGGHLHHDETAVALGPLDRTVRELRRGGWSAKER